MVFIWLRPRTLRGVLRTAARVRVTAPGFFIFASGLITVYVISLACHYGSSQSVLSQSRLHKAIERDPRQRGSKSKRKFRMHARDETELVTPMQAFLLQFCNVLTTT